MKNTSVLFLCLARDCAPTIPNFLEFVRMVSQKGRIKCHVVVGEDGSKDSTREVLEEFRSTMRNITIVDTSFMSEIKGRLNRMANGREFLLNISREKEFDSFDKVCIADIDNVFTTIPPVENFLTELNLLSGDSSLYGISATSRPYYYDLLAYDDGNINFDKIEPDTTKRLIRTYRQFEDRIYRHQRSITKIGRHRCISAFNGLAIYNKSDFQSASYMQSGGTVICEHVVLNREIHSKTRKLMQISDILVLNTPPEHGPVSPLRFYPIKIYRMIKRALLKFGNHAPSK